ncbi:Calx-beta domain-containing protein, partial [Veronia nyctiphanis]
ETAPTVSNIKHLQDNVEGGWLGWTMNMSTASDTATTVTLNFHDAQHTATHQGNKSQTNTPGSDYSGKVHVYDLSGNFLQEVYVDNSNQYQAPITIPAGHTGVKLYALTNNDNVYEGNESLTINAAVIGKQGWVQSEKAYIKDDADIPKVASITNLENVNEGGWLWNKWSVNMTSTSTTDRFVKLKFDDSLHQAKFGDDYTGKIHVYTSAGAWVGEYVLSHNNDINVKVPAGIKHLHVSAEAINDNVYEGNETFVISGHVDGQNWVQSQNSHIIDNETAPNVSAVSSTTVEEGQDATVTVSLSNTSTSTTKIWVDAYNGTAHGGGSDYQETLYVNFGNGWQNLGNFSTGKWVDVPANKSSFQVRVATSNDSTYENTQYFTIRANAEDQAQVSGTVTITDEADNKPSVTDVSDVSVNEGGYAGPVKVTLSGSSTQTTRVQIDLDSGTASRATDYYETYFWVRYGGGSWQKHYGNVSSGVYIDVPAGNSSFELRFDTKNDNIYEDTERFSVWARVEGDGWNSSSGRGEVTINDYYDEPEVTSVSSPDVWEGDTAIFNVSLSNESTSSTTVTLDLQSHSATGYDYNSNLQVSFNNGYTWHNVGNSVNVPSNTDSFKVRVSTKEDSQYEGGEQFKLLASSEYQSNKVSGTATILDDELVPRESSGLWNVSGVEKMTLEMWNIKTNFSIYKNSIGYYTMDSSGNIMSAKVIMSKTSNYGSLNTDIYLNGASKLGLFLIPNGHKIGYSNGDASISLDHDGARIIQNGKKSWVYLSESHRNVFGYDNEDNSGNESKWEDLPGGGVFPWLNPKDVTFNVVARPKDFVTPLLFDLDGDGIETISVDNSKINYDLNADGVSRATGWANGEDGFLVWDINRDGVINNGSEMFGEGTQLADGSRAKDGFEA